MESFGLVEQMPILDDSILQPIRLTAVHSPPTDSSSLTKTWWACAWLPIHLHKIQITTLQSIFFNQEQLC